MHAPGPKRPSRLDVRTLALLCSAFVTLALWSLMVPAWESSDEPDHWQYANYIQRFGELPPYDRQYPEGNEPPLFYTLLSPLARDTNVPAPAKGNLAADGHRYYNNLPRLYPTSQHELRDYSALHIARLATSALSVSAVWFAFLAGRAVTGRRETGLLAGALLAFLPEFSARASMFSADAMVTATCAAGTWLLIRLWRDGYSRRLAAAMGVIGGLALLSKITAVALFAGLLVSVMIGSNAPWHARVVRVWPIGLSLLIASPWLVRNQLTYGDPLAMHQTPIAVGQLFNAHPLFSAYFAATFPITMARSFVGSFGWGNVAMPSAYYLFYAAGTCVILAGMACAARRSREMRGLMMILLAIVGVAILTVVEINLTFTQPQGRYLFAALPAMAVMAAVGLEATPGWSRRAMHATTVLAVCLWILDIALLPLVIVPTYGVRL